ncbi:MAG: Ribosome maturation factor RimP [Eubacteriales bacterium SKADARSKE-1]|nr:Ribosome maturation factor RimP [Eubacteriales bacterium SKADARSKE-1]
MKKSNTVSQVESLAIKLAGDLGLSIWDVKFLKEGSSWYLRIFIDRPNGVTIDDCEKMSRAIDSPLDQLDTISIPYCLEVCSPGIERELTKKEHFEKCSGKNIIIHLIRPQSDGQKDIKGILLSFCDDIIEIAKDDGLKIGINKKDTAWVKLYDFSQGI